ncbi:glycosyltransferase family 4 protein [Corticimicrobacter populi]|uniref:Glycosyltransferase family 1 protein n=1 Tax=Corticimicrobacter populi TaxID=2175229 RepID=A0A2V1JYJ3_9BURK|nr:glycosyltransferase family 1 protein [Corticimicrobacter populi]PWF22182.1 glycosyltransferase family 1 protein [Corticimicrobacter populi]
MSCFFDPRWDGPHGIGRFAAELGARLQVTALALPGRPMSPMDPWRLAVRLRAQAAPGDWFLSPGYNAPLFGSLPCFLTIHDLNHVDRPENSSRMKRLYYRVVLAWLCRRARGVFTVSEFSRQRIVEWFGIQPERVFNVGNGVSPVFVSEGKRVLDYGEYVLGVGNRKGHKNEPALLRAFAQAGLPTHVNLVLTGPACRQLEVLAAELDLSGRLVFTGRVSETQLAALYRGALFLAFPSLYEGFGLPIVEAFSCGTPVLTSNLTSMPEIAGDAALLVDPCDEQDMTRGIQRLYSDAGLRRMLTVRGRERAAVFTWDRVAERLRAAIGTLDNDPDWPLRWS